MTAALRAIRTGVWTLTAVPATPFGCVPRGPTLCAVCAQGRRHGGSRLIWAITEAIAGEWCEDCGVKFDTLTFVPASGTDLEVPR